MSNSRDSHPVLVVLRIGSPRPEGSAKGGWRPLARAVHSGLVGLGATFATGSWPERHGVVRGIEPHPDRLSLTRARPENRGVSAVWSEAVRAGRRAMVVGWPHGTAEMDPVERERLIWTGMPATRPRPKEGENSPVLSPGLVRPPARQPGILARLRDVDHDLTLELLEEHASEGPDLLMGLVVDSTPAETSERLRGIESRLAEARGMKPVVIEVRHPMPADSIIAEHRFCRRPWLRVEGPMAPGLAIRPRVDAIAAQVRSLLGVEPSPPNASSPPGSGFHEGAMDEAGLPRPRRMSIFQLKASEQELHREIGLSLLARGERRRAVPWLRGACQDQHGRLDFRVAVLLLSLADPTERPRLLEQLRPQLGDIAVSAEAFFDGESIVDASSLAPLGPFVAGQVALGLRRSDRLKLADPGEFDEA